MVEKLRHLNTREHCILASSSGSVVTAVCLDKASE
jgi:hypothetical protein